MELRVGKRYRLGRKIGAGSFGDIYGGVDIHTGEEVAIKLESVKSKHPQLLREAKIYRSLHGIVGVPTAKWYGIEGEFHVLVMDLLGKSLEDLFNECGRKFSLQTVIILATQLISHLEAIHRKSLIHRDIKPDNFLIGRGSESQLVYVIDFGLSKLYRDPRIYRHIPYKEGKSLTGTARYASIQTHVGIEQSRRDDMESLGYVLMYFLRGSLPWQGLVATTKKQKYDRICERKCSTSLEVLCAGHPDEFKVYFEYVKSLKFADAPDYAFMRKLFDDLGGRIKAPRPPYASAPVFDWEILALNKKKSYEIKTIYSTVFNAVENAAAEGDAPSAPAPVLSATAADNDNDNETGAPSELNGEFA